MDSEYIQNGKIFLIKKNYLDNIFVNFDNCKNKQISNENNYIMMGDFVINYSSHNLIKKKLFKMLKQSC